MKISNIKVGAIHNISQNVENIPQKIDMNAEMNKKMKTSKTDVEAVFVSARNSKTSKNDRSRRKARRVAKNSKRTKRCWKDNAI